MRTGIFAHVLGLGDADPEHWTVILVTRDAANQALAAALAERRAG